MAKPKVSLVVSDLAGGGAVRAFLLAQVLRQLEHPVQVIGFLFGQTLYADPPQGISVTSIPGKDYPAFLGSARSLLKQLDGDILYAVKLKPTSFGLSLLAKLLSRRPVMVDMDDWELSWHGGNRWRYRPGSLKQFARDLLKPNGQLRFPDHPQYLKWMERLVSRADAVTIDTQFLQNRFGGVYIPNGKDTDLFDPSPYNPEDVRDRNGLSNYRILMFPGSPRPHKGLEDILQALDRLNQPRLRLAIVGGSPYDDYDQKLVERWGRWIVQLPRRPIEAMPEAIAAAHVVVVPQRDTAAARAQFPLKLTDGMAMAKPVLSTRVGDIPEILGETGYLADPDCPEQLAEQIEHIFQNFEEAEARGQQARQRCLELYSVKAMAPTLEEVIAGLKL